MTTLYGIFYEGRQYGEALPEREAIGRLKRLSLCCYNLDLRIVDAKDVQLKAVR